MTVGLICEYNPFHNGHLYHLNKVKKLYPDSTIVLVLSGNFLQRGDVSVINKWDKTRIALEYGINLIVELPFVFATQSADIFAKGAVSILNHLKVDVLVFGSEINDIVVLTKLADMQINNLEFDTLVKKNSQLGLSYPASISAAFEALNGSKIDSPNDLLGISYIKQIKLLNSAIKPISIKRTSDYHSNKLSSKIVSASAIRNALKNKKNIKKFVPKESYKYIKNIHIDDYFEYLKYKIICSDDLTIYNQVDEKIANKIKNNILEYDDLEQFIFSLKTKNYTYNRLKRMLTSILCDFKKSSNTELQYIRVLGFDTKGKQYLNKIKKSISIPIITNYDKILDLELKATTIYSLKLDKSLIEMEYKNKPIMK